MLKLELLLSLRGGPSVLVLPMVQLHGCCSCPVRLRSILASPAFGGGGEDVRSAHAAQPPHGQPCTDREERTLEGEERPMRRPMRPPVILGQRLHIWRWRAWRAPLF